MLKFRKPELDDAALYFEWTNDLEVREQSFNSKTIAFESHQKWFIKKLDDPTCLMLLFSNERGEDIGQIRFQEESDSDAVIGISISSVYRGRGYAKEMLQLASDYFLRSKPKFTINAYIKEQNLSSKYAFEKAKFEFIKMIDYENFKSFHYIKKLV